MYQIPNDDCSAEFALCWQAAGNHLQACAGGQINTWLRAHLSPPFLEHLSFRLGNQLFFIRIYDADGAIDAPGSIDGLLSIAEGCGGHACKMPMRKTQAGWKPVLPQWGMICAMTGREIVPPFWVSSQLIEMTDWELHDFAVQVVRDQLEKSNKQVTSWQTNPKVDPSIWYKGDNGLEWVLVRASRLSHPSAILPDNWEAVANNCSRLSMVGHFASVAVASMTNRPNDNKLYRGDPFTVKYEGLITLDAAPKPKKFKWLSF